MTSDQIEVESQVMKYIKFLNDKKIDISKLKAKNTAFSSIQNEFIKTIEDCISASENRINEVRNGAVWDNLVIAFFGETNAGKSTIIETFRILFNENSNSSEIGNDGLIVGNGESDYTQIYSEYHMRINGVPFTLIDVPGIEGNESKYEKEIKEALNKAHYVFYVQGQNKRPDSGTASKIKQYLREWVRVYSIYNIKGIASKFKEPCQREILLSDSEKKIENQIEETFHEVLGDTYMGNISIQAFLAMCSKASFSSTRPDLLRGQSKLMSYFEDRDSLFSFSLFQSLINVVLQKAQNFRNEILNAKKWSKLEIKNHQEKMIDDFLTVFDLPQQFQLSPNWNQIVKDQVFNDEISPLDDEASTIVTGSKPKSIIIDDQIFKVSNWQDVFITFLKFIRDDDNFGLDKIFNNQTKIFGIKDGIITWEKLEQKIQHSEDVKNRYKSFDGLFAYKIKNIKNNELFININISAKNCIEIIANIMNEFDINEDFVKISIN